MTGTDPAPPPFAAPTSPPPPYHSPPPYDATPYAPGSFAPTSFAPNPYAPNPYAPSPYGATLYPATPPPRRRRTALFVGAGVASAVAAVVAVALILAGTGRLHLVPGGVIPLPGTAAARVYGHHPKAAALPPALRLGPAAADGTLISPGQASRILQAFWPLREKAMTDISPATIAELDTGPAAIADRSRTLCGCLRRTSPAPYSAAEVVVPRQHTYPAYFMAEAITVAGQPLGPWQERMVFVRASADASWTLMLDTGSTPDVPGPGHLDALQVDAQGYSAPVSRAQARVAAQLPTRLASYWTQAKLTGSQPPLGWFQPGSWTTQEAAALGAHPEGTEQFNGLTGHFRFVADDAVPVFALREAGQILACGALSIDQIYTPGPAGAPHQGADLEPYGAGLAPGTYRSVDRHQVSETCFRIPPDGAGPGTVVTGGDYLHEGTTSGSR